MHMMSMHVTSICLGLASVPNLYAQHTYQFLTHMLSVRIKVRAYVEGSQSQSTVPKSSKILKNCCGHKQIVSKAPQKIYFAHNWK
jgi:hypothetical protein